MLVGTSAKVHISLANVAVHFRSLQLYAGCSQMHNMARLLRCKMTNVKPFVQVCKFVQRRACWMHYL